MGISHGWNRQAQLNAQLAAKSIVEGARVPEAGRHIEPEADCNQWKAPLGKQVDAGGDLRFLGWQFGGVPTASNCKWG
jgi:hypothetical protein